MGTLESSTSKEAAKSAWQAPSTHPNAKGDGCSDFATPSAMDFSSAKAARPCSSNKATAHNAADAFAPHRSSQAAGSFRSAKVGPFVVGALLVEDSPRIDEGSTLLLSRMPSMSSWAVSGATCCKNEDMNDRRDMNVTGPNCDRG